MQIRCDRCDRTIDVANPVIGQKVTCPNCGDVNIIRSAEPAAAPPKPNDLAAQAGYPPADGPEVVVERVHPALFRARPFTSLLVVGVLIAGAVTGVYWLTVPARNLAIASGAITVLAAGVILYWKIMSLTTGLKLTTKRVIDVEGLLSRATSEVMYVNIQNVQIRQTFWQRMLGVGDIALSSSAEHEDEIELTGVADPDRIRRLIDLYR